MGENKVFEPDKSRDSRRVEIYHKWAIAFHNRFEPVNSIDDLSEEERNDIDKIIEEQGLGLTEEEFESQVKTKLSERVKEITALADHILRAEENGSKEQN